MDAGRDSSLDALLVRSLGARAERPPRPVSTMTQLHPAASHPARSIRRDNGYDVVGTATCDDATRDARVKGAPVLAAAEKHPMALLPARLALLSTVPATRAAPPARVAPPSSTIEQNVGVK